MTKISVVIPTYNNESFLVEAIESVFRQTFGDYELIVVDDGSTDRSRALIEPYMSRLKYHYQENQGLAVARNVGLSLAQGEYVTYLDGDDVWNDDNLATKVAVLARFPDIGGVFSEFSIFDQTGERDARGTKVMFPFFERTGWDYAQIFEERHEVEVNGRALPVYVGNVFEKLFFGNFILPTSMVFHRERALATGMFRAHMRTQQDYEYWLRYSRQHRFAFIDHVLVRYRRHEQQLTNHRNIERILNAVEEIINQYEGEFASRGRMPIYNKRKAELLANFAKTHIRKGEPQLARRRLAEGIRRQPGSAVLYLLFLMSFVPYGAIARLRGTR